MSTELDHADLMTYDDLCARLYADKRMPPGTRELALALAWANLRDPQRHDPEAKGSVSRAGRLLGHDQLGWRHKKLFAEDRPRYEPPERDGWHTGSCEGPRMRPYRQRNSSGYYKALQSQKGAGENLVCGATANIRVIERDMVTGWQRAHWFCRRHSDQAERVKEQVERMGEAPPPIPNRGGLLPCYFQAKAVEKVYRWADKYWEPPYYGICADDWPIPGQQIIPRRPRLSLVVDLPDVEAS